MITLNKRETNNFLNFSPTQLSFFMSVSENRRHGTTLTTESGVRIVGENVCVTWSLSGTKTHCTIQSSHPLMYQTCELVFPDHLLTETRCHSDPVCPMSEIRREDDIQDVHQPRKNLKIKLE